MADKYFDLPLTGQEVQNRLNNEPTQNEKIAALEEAIKAFVNSEQVQTLINTALEPYSTTEEMNAAINAAITGALTAYYTKTATDTLLANKVDKVSGKQLSTEDFTSALKTKLDALPTSAGLATQISTAISTALESYYNKTQVDNLLAPKQTAAQVSAAITSALTSYYTKSEVDSLITTLDQEYVSVTATAQTTAVTDLLPATGAADTIYRVGNWDGTQYDPTMYALFAWNGTTYVCLAVRSFVGEVYDISVNHPDGQGNPTPYADLTAALGTDGANIPADFRRGGMSIKFIQGNAQSSDNKYVQYRLMSQVFSTTVSDWQGVDTQVTVWSKNLVESDGVFKSLQELQIKRFNEQTVTTKWTPVLYNLPAGTVIYYRIHALIPNVANVAFAKNNSWSVQNIILQISGQVPRYGYITLDSAVKYFGLLFYSAPSTYNGLNIEVSLNPMYGSLIGEITDVNNKVVTNLNGDNIITYYTPLFKNLKAETTIYTYLKAQPSSVHEGQIALVNRNAWSSDAILKVLTLGKPENYKLSEDSDVGLRFYNSNLTSFVDLDLDVSLSSYYNKVEDVAKYVDFPEYTETTITVDINGTGSFTSIREAVKSITDATEKKRYIVFVKNGQYNEIDIVTKSYVNIVGESKDGVIIYTDGNSTANSPSDYHFNNFANTPINQIPLEYKHLLWHCSRSTVSNMTMIIDNCKYVVHQDESTGAYVATVKDCVLKRIGSNNAGILAGAGLRHGQYVEYVSCDFITTVSNYYFQDFSLAVFAHNLANDNGKCGVTIKDSNVYNCHITQFNDLGSPNQQSTVVVDNVHVDSDFYGILINGTEGVALTTKLEIKNCKPNFVLLTDTAISYFKNALNPYTMSICQASENIQLGQPVSVNKYGSIVPVGIAESSDNFVLALENINSGNIGFVSTGNIGLALAEAGTYVQGDFLYIYNGKFTKTVHGEKVAFVMRGKTLSSDGLLIICKLL